MKLIDTDDATTTSQPSHFRYEVIHEFGHALGFAHEMQRPDNFNSGVMLLCPGADGNYAKVDGGIYFTMNYDQSSIMSYCAKEPGTSSGYVQNLSPGDTSGVQAAYGAPTLSNSVLGNERAILWRNTSTGMVSAWLLADDGTFLTQSFPQPSTSSVGNDWQIRGTGRFDGDGIGDILWRNSTSGATSVWLMSGGSIRQQTFPLNPGTSWDVAGVGDFNNDGTSDVLWRNTSNGSVVIWFMAGGAIATQATLTTPGTAWQISGTGDFNGDGKSDILWRDSTNGTVAIWFMNNGAIASQAFLSNPGTAWQISGVGDFNGNGKSDILWRDSTNGTVATWFMNGGSIASQAFYANPGTTWQVRAVGDYNADGKSDIVWHQTSGQVGIWFMNGGTIAGQAFPGPLAASPWQIQGALRDLR